MNAPKGPFTWIRDALKATAALRNSGVDILLGARAQSNTTAPNRIVLIPLGGKYSNPSDKSAAIFDLPHAFRAECWGKGQTTDRDSDFDAAWYIQILIIQALDEISRDWMKQGGAGPLFDGVSCEWNPDPDSYAQGAALAVSFTLTFAVQSTSTDEGHVGPQWSQGTVNSESTNITGFGAQ